MHKFAKLEYFVPFHTLIDQWKYHTTFSDPFSSAPYRPYSALEYTHESWPYIKLAVTHNIVIFHEPSRGLKRDNNSVNGKWEFAFMVLSADSLTGEWEKQLKRNDLLASNIWVKILLQLPVGFFDFLYVLVWRKLQATHSSASLPPSFITFKQVLSTQHKESKREMGTRLINELFLLLFLFLFIILFTIWRKVVFNKHAMMPNIRSS